MIIRLSKSNALALADASEAIEHIIVHGQNYDYELNQIFLTI
jgi:hypothetical protein